MKLKIANKIIETNLPPEIIHAASGVISDYIIDGSDEKDPQIRINIYPAVPADGELPEHDEKFSGIKTKKIKINNNNFLAVYTFLEGLPGCRIIKTAPQVYNAAVFLRIPDTYLKAMQNAILHEVLDDGILGMHGVTMEHEGRVILLSAPSGTGKTTHSELWKEHLGAKIINGDYAFLKCEENINKINFIGTPFCGSSPYCENGVWGIDEIVIIKQGPVNIAERLTGQIAYIKLIENAFIPRWETDKAKIALDLAAKVLSNIRIWQLTCTPEREAAFVLKKALF